MSKRKEIEHYCKLSKEKKGKLTLLWLTDLIKTENLTLQDVIDILNNVDDSFTKLDKFNSMLINNNVSASTISRLFGYGYAKSMSVINELLQQNAIIKYTNTYKIVDKDKFKLVGEKLFKSTDVNND